MFLLVFTKLFAHFGWFYVPNNGLSRMRCYQKKYNKRIPFAIRFQHSKNGEGIIQSNRKSKKYFSNLLKKNLL